MLFQIAKIPNRRRNESFDNVAQAFPFFFMFEESGIGPVIQHHVLAHTYMIHRNKGPRKECKRNFVINGMVKKSPIFWLLSPPAFGCLAHLVVLSTLEALFAERFLVSLAFFVLIFAWSGVKAVEMEVSSFAPLNERF